MIKKSWNSDARGIINKYAEYFVSLLVRASQKEEFHSGKREKSPSNGTMFSSKQRGGGATKVTVTQAS